MPGEIGAQVNNTIASGAATSFGLVILIVIVIAVIFGDKEKRW